MLRTTIALIGLLGIMIAYCGCTKAPSAVEAHYAVCYHQALDNQTLHPEASENLEPCVGLDGQAAVIVMDKYRESFKCKEEKQPMISIVGGGNK